MKSMKLTLDSMKKFDVLNKEALKQVKGGLVDGACPPPVDDKED